MGGKDKKSKSSWVDPDDAPEWSDDVFERAELRHGDKVVRAATGTLTKRGRPKLENPKRQVTLRLDGDVLDRFRASGAGWQVRINEALRKAVGL
jgi:uncharacterized protein (DUF4415 family)